MTMLKTPLFRRALPEILPKKEGPAKKNGGQKETEDHDPTEGAALELLEEQIQTLLNGNNACLREFYLRDEWKRCAEEYRGRFHACRLGYYYICMRVCIHKCAYLYINTHAYIHILFAGRTKHWRTASSKQIDIQAPKQHDTEAPSKVKFPDPAALEADARFANWEDFSHGMMADLIEMLPTQVCLCMVCVCCVYCVCSSDGRFDGDVVPTGVIMCGMCVCGACVLSVLCM
jgi:hypothetical protein